MRIGVSGEQPTTSQAEGVLTETFGKKTLDVQGKAMAKLSGQPLVSVIIPTYNRAWALGKAVRSVFEQTYRPIECIIVDDGSTDDTSDIVKGLVNECPEAIDIKYFKKKNGGPNSARNRGLLECKGDFICYLDSDDMLTRDSINERAQILIKDPDVDFCYGLCSIRNEHDREIGRMNERWPTSDEPRITLYLFNTNSPLIRRSTCARTGLWREDDLHGQELEYFARLKYFSNKVHFIDKILSLYFRHKNESIFDNASIDFSLSVFRMLLAVKTLVVYGKYDNRQERRQLSMMFRNRAKQLFRSGDYSNACAALEESLILRKNIPVFVQWLIVKLMQIISHKRYR